MYYIFIVVHSLLPFLDAFLLVAKLIESLTLVVLNVPHLRTRYSAWVM